MAGNGANMLQVRVAHLGLDRTTNTPVVILQENDGQRVLPIWIGPAEASAIAMELAGVKFSRPLTHDLLKQVIVGLGAELRKVIITQVKDNTYFAELHVYRGDTIIQIDARPSDSIALALRLKAPILTSETLLELTSIDTSETGIQPGGSGAGGGGTLDADSLKSYLQNLDPEDFGKFTP
jgi:bifunctional DNase/RNase